jgi:hypothetical protein
VLEGVPALHPQARSWHSNRLRAEDADPDTVRLVRSRFAGRLRDRDGNPPSPRLPCQQLLEKTPKNALRVPFLARVFPRATFVYVFREPAEVMSSMLDGWRSGHFVTYPRLPGWRGPAWSFLLVPRWRQLSGRGLPKIVATQWASTMSILLHDLAELPPSRWCTVHFDELTSDPQSTLDRLGTRLDIGWDQHFPKRLPNSRSTLTPPRPGKWQTNSAEIDRMLPFVADVARRARRVAVRS